MKYISLAVFTLVIASAAQAQTAQVTPTKTSTLSPRARAIIQANSLASQKRMLDANLAAARQRNAEATAATAGTGNTPVKQMPLTPNRNLEATPVKTRQ